MLLGELYLTLMLLGELYLTFQRKNSARPCIWKQYSA